MEMVSEAKVLLVYMKCEKCGNGLMRPFGNEVVLTSPPQFAHKCDNCGHEELYHARYPYQKIVPIESLREPTESESN